MTLRSDKKIDIPVKSHSKGLHDFTAYGASDVYLASSNNYISSSKFQCKQTDNYPFGDVSNDHPIANASLVATLFATGPLVVGNVNPCDNVDNNPQVEEPPLVTVSIEDLDGSLKISAMKMSTIML
jgi:hypothetical protein